ncbi:MAG: hypothetical protein WA700_12740 [Acidobacteriaceae bacterium]
MTIALFGWIATGVQTVSYFVPKASTLKKIQAVAACVWIVYGIKMGASPVIAANLIVGAAALLTALRSRATAAGPPPLLPVIAGTESNVPDCD